MRIRSPIDWIVTALYRPILVILGSDIVLVPLSLLAGWPSRDYLLLASQGEFGLAGFLFLLALCDGGTRRAVNRFNAVTHAEGKSLPWWRHIFHRIGDRRLQICAFILWCEGMFSFFVPDEIYRTLAASGFFVSVVTVILTLKLYLPHTAPGPQV